ncbi:MAG: hypothetical protein JKY52_20935 [Flavobacteriales bacterium]|nr:hypothetical protein [Flavobacteriales bacterium]
MRYFNNNGSIYAYDTDQQELINTAIALGWGEVDEPEQPEPEANTSMSSLTFLNRFTTAEEDAVVSSTILDVKKIYGRMMGADYVDVANQATIDGVDGLIAYGLIESSNRAAILAPV